MPKNLRTKRYCVTGIELRQRYNTITKEQEQ